MQVIDLNETPRDSAYQVSIHIGEEDDYYVRNFRHSETAQRFSEAAMKEGIIVKLKNTIIILPPHRISSIVLVPIVTDATVTQGDPAE